MTGHGDGLLTQPINLFTFYQAILLEWVKLIDSTVLPISLRWMSILLRRSMAVAALSSLVVMSEWWCNRSLHSLFRQGMYLARCPPENVFLHNIEQHLCLGYVSIVDVVSCWCWKNHDLCFDLLLETVPISLVEVPSLDGSPLCWLDQGWCWELGNLSRMHLTGSVWCRRFLEKARSGWLCVSWRRMTFTWVLVTIRVRTSSFGGVRPSMLSCRIARG